MTTTTRAPSPSAYFLPIKTITTALRHGAPLEALDPGDPLWISSDTDRTWIHHRHTCNMLPPTPAPFTWRDDLSAYDNLLCCPRCMPVHPMWPVLVHVLANHMSLRSQVDALQQPGTAARRLRPRRLANLDRWLRATGLTTRTSTAVTTLPEPMREWADTMRSTALAQVADVRAELDRMWKGKPTPDHGHQWVLLHTIPSLLSDHYLNARALVTWDVVAQSEQGKWILVHAPVPDQAPTWMSTLLNGPRAVVLGRADPTHARAAATVLADLYPEAAYDSAPLAVTRTARNAWQAALAVTA